jgi:hypothetical protein
MPRLIVQSEEQAGQIFDLTGETYRVGRIANNEIVIQHKSISSHHAELTLNGHDYRLKDLDSTNGTRVNAERIKEVKLRRNDAVRLGNIELLYESEYEPDVQPMPEAHKGINLGECSSKGRPNHFKNLSPLPKQEDEGKTPWGTMTTAGIVFALCGIGFLIFKLVSL